MSKNLKDNKDKKPIRLLNSHQRKQLDEAALQLIPYIEAKKAYDAWAEDFSRKTANMSEREVINYVNRQKNDERIARANHWEGVMNFLSPGQWFGAAVNSEHPQDYWSNIWYGNSGWVTPEVARNSTALALAANGIGDGIFLGNAIKGIRGGKQLYNESVRPSLRQARQNIRDYIIADRLNKAAKKFDGTVGEEYFESPDNFYRWASSNEIEQLREQGLNVTSRDAMDYPSQANDFRNFVLENRLQPGTGENEGYFVLTDDIKKANIRAKHRQEMIESGELKKGDYSIFDEDDVAFIQKSGSAHGNRSQGAWAKLWKGSRNTTSQFPEYVIEGKALEDGTIDAGIGNNRSRYRRTSIEEVPIGHRIGFKTGEMPMEGLRAFRKLKDGKFAYEGEILPDKVLGIGKNPRQRSGRLMFYERPSKRITSAEKEGIPRGERNNTSKPVKDFGTYGVEDWNNPISDLGKFIGDGEEAIVFEKDGRVYKAYHNPSSSTDRLGKVDFDNPLMDAFNKQLIGEFIKRHVIPKNKHSLFEPIKFEGIVDDGYGRMAPVVSQKKLKPAAEGWITDEAKAKILNQLKEEALKQGYILDKSPYEGLALKNEYGKIFDLHPWNLGYDENGNIRIFDMMTQSKLKKTLWRSYNS